MRDSADHTSDGDRHFLFRNATPAVPQ